MKTSIIKLFSLIFFSFLTIFRERNITELFIEGIEGN